MFLCKPWRAVLACACALALLAALSAPVAAASATQQAIIEDDSALAANPVATLAQMRALGATRVRIFVTWSAFAPHPNWRRRPRFDAANPAVYPRSAWYLLDEEVRLATADHLGVYLVLTGPAPRWAQGPGAPASEPFGRSVWDPNALDFGAFVKAIGTRYDGHYTPPGQRSPLPAVRFWSLWNEPNYGYNLAPQSAGSAIQRSAAIYRSLLAHGYAALRASGHRHDTILFGELAPHGQANGGNFAGVAPLLFLRALYCVNGSFRQLRGALAKANGCPTSAAGSRRFRADNPALFYASGLAAHLYAQGTPPNRSLNDPCVRGQDRADYADLGDVGKLELTLDRLQRVYGSRRRMPIYNTEYGYQTHPPQPRSCAANSLPVSIATAAYYINWAEYISYRDPQIESYAQYLLADPPKGNFDSGLEFSNGRPKRPLFGAYMLPLYMPTTRVRRPSRLLVWGAVRPWWAARQLSSPPAALLQFQAGHRGRWQTLATITRVNPSGYFELRLRFVRSGSLRLLWHNPLVNRTYSSRTIGVEVR